jgi:hypothetical protein
VVVEGLYGHLLLTLDVCLRYFFFHGIDTDADGSGPA